MRHPFYYPFALFFLLLSFIGCKKNNDPTKNATLPPATQEGKNTIGFTINGEVWVPYYKCKLFGNPCGEISADYNGPPSGPNNIGFGFSRERNNKLSFLVISSAFATITSIGDKIDSIGVNFTGENWTGNTDSYSGILTGSKFVITKLDMQNQIMSGEFEFIMSEDNRSGKTVIIKDGRFDFKFNACKCSN